MRRRMEAWLRFPLLVALLAGTGLFLRSRSQAENLPPRAPLGSFPLQLGNWKGTEVPISPEIREVLGAGEFLERNYGRTPDEPSIDLLLAYFPSQRLGSTMHSPQNCLPGSGWTPVEFARVELTHPGGDPIKVNRYLLAKGLDRIMLLYWYEEHGRAVASEYWAKFYLVADAIRMNRSDGALVRLSTPLARNESADSAEQRLVEFSQPLRPLLNAFIPR